MLDILTMFPFYLYRKREAATRNGNLNFDLRVYSVKGLVQLSFVQWFDLQSWFENYAKQICFVSLIPRKT